MAIGKLRECEQPKTESQGTPNTIKVAAEAMELEIQKKCWTGVGVGEWWSWTGVRGWGVVKLDRGGGQGMTDNSALARGTHKESANIGCSGNLCWVICLRFCLSLIALDPGDTHKHTHTHMGGGTRDRDRQRQTWRYTIYRKLIRNIFIWVDFLRVKRNIKLNTYRKII